MARRIDIELTSERDDGSWTWRAAGARQPRGVLDGSLLYEGAKAGDTVRADAEFEIDGIVIVSVAPPRDKEKERVEPDRLEILGPRREPAPGVTTSLTGRTERRPPGRRRDRGDGRVGPERPDRPGGAPTRGRQQSGARHGRTDAGSRPGRSDRGSRRTDQEEAPPPNGNGADAGEPAGDSAEPAGGEQRRRPRAEPSERRGAGGGSRPGPATRETTRARRLNPGNTHRQAVLDDLAAEERPVAEQVLRGGIPAVRTALHLEREKAAAEGRAAPNAEALLAMAERLLPRLKSAEWRDRAEAAVRAADDISLRDLRSVVAGADAARDDETRALAVTLRERLDQRLAKLHGDWELEISRHLDDNRVVRALRLAGRPPEPSARLTAELSTRLSGAAGQAMTPDTAPERWAALLEAAAASPVRRTVKPAGLPSDATAELRRAAQQQAGRIPALAAILGIAIPPPPGPPRPAEAARRQGA